MAPPTELCTKTNDASPILLRWLGRAPLPVIQESYLATPPDTPSYQKTRDEYAAAVSCALDRLSTTNPRRAVDLLASLTETDEAMGRLVGQRLQSSKYQKVWEFPAVILGASITLGDDVAKEVPRGNLRSELIRHYEGRLKTGTRVTVKTLHLEETLRLGGTLVVAQPLFVVLAFYSITAEQSPSLSMTGTYLFPPDFDALLSQYPDLPQESGDAESL